MFEPKSNLCFLISFLVQVMKYEHLKYYNKLYTEEIPVNSIIFVIVNCNSWFIMNIHKGPFYLMQSKEEFICFTSLIAQFKY